MTTMKSLSRHRWQAASRLSGRNRDPGLLPCSDRAPRQLAQNGFLQFTLENLTGILARQRVSKLDLFWDLVAGEPRPSDPRGWTLRPARRRYPGLDKGTDLLSELVIRNAEHRAVRDARHLHQFRLDFGRTGQMFGATENDQQPPARPDRYSNPLSVVDRNLPSPVARPDRRAADFRPLVRIAVIGKFRIPVLASANDFTGLTRAVATSHLFVHDHDFTIAIGPAADHRARMAQATRQRCRRSPPPLRSNRNALLSPAPTSRSCRA